MDVNRYNRAKKYLEKVLLHSDGSKISQTEWCQLLSLGQKPIITVRKRSLGRLCFKKVSVYPQGGGKYLGSYHPPRKVTPGMYPPYRYTPWVGTSPWAGPPPGRYPLEQCMLLDTNNKRVVRILLECILVWQFFLPKICMKMKEIGPRGGASLVIPLDLPMPQLSGHCYLACVDMSI